MATAPPNTAEESLEPDPEVNDNATQFSNILEVKTTSESWTKVAPTFAV